MHFGVNARENDVDAFLVVHLDECLQVVDACRVDEGHFPHADDANLRLLVPDVLHQIVELVGNAEEVGAVDFIDCAAFGDDQMLLVDCHIRSVAKVYFVLDDRNLGGLHDALHEEGAGQDEADLNRDGEVEDNRQEEGHA